MTRFCSELYSTNQLISMLHTQALLVSVIFVVWQTSCVRGKKCLVKGEFRTSFPQIQSHYFIRGFLVHTTMLSLDRCFWSRIIFCFKIRLLWQLIRVLVDVLMLSTLSVVCLVQLKGMIPFVHGVTNAVHWQKEWDASLLAWNGPNGANWIVKFGLKVDPSSCTTCECAEDPCLSKNMSSWRGVYREELCAMWHPR